MQTGKLLIFLVIFFIGSISTVNAQNAGQKSLLQQLEEEEESERKKNSHQGPSQPASKSLQKARENAKSNANTCPAGSTVRKIEDVRVFLEKQEGLQQKLASSLERFTSNSIPKNSAILEFNQLIEESNEVVKWGWGKVTNGACGSPKQTEIIGKAVSATKILIEEYKRVLE
jgi:hypothetical protein